MGKLVLGHFKVGDIVQCGGINKKGTVVNPQDVPQAMIDEVESDHVRQSYLPIKYITRHLPTHWGGYDGFPIGSVTLSDTVRCPLCNAEFQVKDDYICENCR